MVSSQRTIDSLTIGRNNIHVVKFTRNKISQYQDNNIETLSERLESLQITNKASEKNNRIHR